MTQPAAPAQGVSPTTVIAAAAIGLALIAVETQVRQAVEDAINDALTAIGVALAAALAATLATPAVVFITANELLSDPTVHKAIRTNLDAAHIRVTTSVRGGYSAAAHIALARVHQDLGTDDASPDLPELGDMLDALSRDINTMFGHAEADLANSIRAAYDGVQGTDAPVVRPVVTAQAITEAANRLHQRAAAAASTAVNQGSSDAQQAIWADYRNTTGDHTLAKRWVVTASDPCQMCLDLNGTVVGIDAEFDHGLSGSDWRPIYRNLLGPPRHPNCRCQLELVHQ